MFFVLLMIGLTILGYYTWRGNEIYYAENIAVTMRPEIDTYIKNNGNPDEFKYSQKLRWGMDYEIYFDVQTRSLMLLIKGRFVEYAHCWVIKKG